MAVDVYLVCILKTLFVSLHGQPNIRVIYVCFLLSRMKMRIEDAMKKIIEVIYYLSLSVKVFSLRQKVHG